MAVIAAREAGLRSDDFGLRRHEVIWRAIDSLFDTHSKVDVLTVTDELERTHMMEHAGGFQALNALVLALPTSAHVADYATRIVEAANLRRISAVCHMFHQAALTRDGTSSEILSALQDEVMDLNRRAVDDLGIVNRPATVDEVLEDIDRPREEGSLPTGFRALDEIMGDGGLVPGRLYILAARPAMGKSALGLQVATNVADLGVPGLMLSLEMTGKEMIAREIAVRSQRSKRAWRGLDRDGRARVSAAGAEVRDRPLFLVDRGGLDLAGVIYRTRRLVEKEGIGLLVVDYLGLVNAGNRYKGDRNNEIGEITKALKALAQNLKIPVLALAQLNREVEKRPKKHPQMSDLRDSGNIEQDADLVMFLHREEYYYVQRGEPVPEDVARVADVIVAKNRHGATGIARLGFDGATTRFANLKDQPDF